MLVASPHATRWPTSNHPHHMSIDGSASHQTKRKRSSCGGVGSFEMDASAMATSAPLSEVARGKRSRIANLPAPSTTSLSTSPSNIPFSSHFRASSVNRPPTVEEQQSWASSSSHPIASPPAGVFATASPQWVKVQTDYGHAFVREDSEEQGMVIDTQQATSSSSSSSLWRHIEGDTEMMTNSQSQEALDSFDPDTSRRGDSFAWEEDILQLRVPASLPHPHPYSPSPTSGHSTRSQLGAAYFDQCVQQAARW